VTRILYVEDNDDNVYMLKMRLELLEGFEVLVAGNGETGCAQAIAQQPDVILMDLDLPVVDGWEATRRLKSNPATSPIPIIALTAHAMSGSREKALAAGCDEFDTKPVDFDRLLKKIVLVLGNKVAVHGGD
jgi:two-component system cell cycle response regulator DivK